MGEGKSFFKHWTGVLVLVAVAVLVTWALVNLPQVVNVVQGKWTVYKSQRAFRALESAYNNDKYGGKTPEETYDLLIAALEKGDVELASKYFVIEKQDDWLGTFEEYKKNSYLANFTEELKNTKTKWSEIETNNPNTVGFRYKSLIEKDTESEFEGQKITIPAGNYTNETMFQKYPSGVWKIEAL